MRRLSMLYVIRSTHAEVSVSPLQRAAQPIREWKDALEQDESANATVITTGSKRKAAAVSIQYPPTHSPVKVVSCLVCRNTVLTGLRVCV